MSLPIEALSKTEFAEKYVEILQPLETTVAVYYHENNTMHDFDVMHAYGQLLKYIKAKLTNYPLPQITLQGISLELYHYLFEQIELMEQSYTHHELQLALKQLEKSVKFWNREHGSQGYLNFISNYV